jgi:hypothetical protein
VAADPGSADCRVLPPGKGWVNPAGSGNLFAFGRVSPN